MIEITGSALDGGGFCNVVDFDPHVPGRALLGGDVSGVHRSTNDGLSWTGVNAHCWQRQHLSVGCIRWDPNVPHRAWSGTGGARGSGSRLWRSDDAGLTWSSVATASSFGTSGQLFSGSAIQANELPAPWTQWEDRPRSTGRMIEFDTTGDTMWIATFDDGVWVSTNDGVSGSRIAAAGEHCRGVWFVPSTDTLWACTIEGNVYRIRNATSSPTSPTVTNLAAGIQERAESIAANGTTVVVCDRFQGIRYSTNDGASWARATGPAHGSSLTAAPSWISVTYADGQFWAGSMNPHRVNPAQQLMRSPNGVSWTNVIPRNTTTIKNNVSIDGPLWWKASTLGASQTITSGGYAMAQFAISPHNSQRWLSAGTASVWGTHNGGQQWYPFCRGAGVTISREMLKHPVLAEGMLQGNTDWMVVHWADIQGQPQRAQPASDIRNNATVGFCLASGISPTGTPTAVLGAGARGDIGNTRGDVFISTAQGVPQWSSLGFDTAASQRVPWGIAVGWTSGGTLVVVTIARGSGLWRYVEGSGWSNLSGQISAPGGNPQKARMLWVQGTQRVFALVPNQGLKRSTDAGATWTTIWNPGSFNEDSTGDLLDAGGDVLWVTLPSGTYRIANASTVTSGTVAANRTQVLSRHSGPLAQRSDGTVWVACGATSASVKGAIFECSADGSTATDRSTASWEGNVVEPMAMAFTDGDALMVSAYGQGTKIEASGSTTPDPPSTSSRLAVDATTTGNGSDTLTLPSVRAGDLLVAFGHMNNGNSTTPTGTWSAGWTELATIDNGSGASVWASAAYRVADGTETTVSLTGLTGGARTLSAHRIRHGLDPEPGWTVTASAASSPSALSHNFPAQTVGSAANDIVLLGESSTNTLSSTWAASTELAENPLSGSSAWVQLTQAGSFVGAVTFGQAQAAALISVLVRSTPEVTTPDPTEPPAEITPPSLDDPEFIFHEFGETAGIAAEDTVTTSNSDYDAIVTSGASTTLVWDEDWFIDPIGEPSLRATLVLSQEPSAQGQRNIGTNSDTWERAWFRVTDGFPHGVDIDLVQLTNGTDTLATVRIEMVGSDAALAIVGPDGNTLTQSTFLPATIGDTEWRLEWRGDLEPEQSAIEARLWLTPFATGEPDRQVSVIDVDLTATTETPATGVSLVGTGVVTNVDTIDVSGLAPQAGDLIVLTHHWNGATADDNSVGWPAGFTGVVDSLANSPAAPIRTSAAHKTSDGTETTLAVNGVGAGARTLTAELWRHASGSSASWTVSGANAASASATTHTCPSVTPTDWENAAIVGIEASVNEDGLDWSSTSEFASELHYHATSGSSAAHTPAANTAFAPVVTFTTAKPAALGTVLIEGAGVAATPSPPADRWLVGPAVMSSGGTGTVSVWWDDHLVSTADWPGTLQVAPPVPDVIERTPFQPTLPGLPEVGRELLVHVRDDSLRRVARLDFETIDVRLRHQRPGAWLVTLDAEAGGADLLRRGTLAGVEVVLSTKVTGPNVDPVNVSATVLSGPLNARDVIAGDDGVSVTASGPGDGVLLEERIISPQPATALGASPSAAWSTSTHDTRSGVLSSVLRGFVDANLGPSALPDRRVSQLTLAVDPVVGSSVTTQGRGQILGEKMRELAFASGSLIGWQVVQSGTSLDFRILSPTDRRNTVVFSEDHQNLPSWRLQTSGPSATTAIVAGQGEGTARQFVEVSTSGDGRRVERWVDARNSETTELVQAGDAALVDGASETSIVAEVADGRPWVFGVHYQLGDVVTVVVDGVEFAQQVTEVRITASATDGLRVTPIVGTPSAGSPFEPPYLAALQRLSRRVTEIEVQ